MSQRINNQAIPDKLVWHTEKRKINDLIAYQANPRQMTEKQIKDLKKSLEKFNLVEIPAIDPHNKIISGHQRMKILQWLGRGEETIDVRVPNRELTQEEFEEYLLRANKNLGEWDFDLLANFDLEILKDVGFDNQELDRLLGKDEKEQDDDVPELPAQAKSKLGDIYQLENSNGLVHCLMAGDATKEEDVRQLMNGKKAHMCFIDPPYNVNYEGSMGTHEKHQRQGILNDNLSQDDFYQFLCAVCKNINHFCIGGTYICMSSSQLDTLKKAYEESGGHFQSFIIWVKNHFTLSRADYQQMYEPILYGWSKDTTSHYFIGSRDIANVWEDLKQVKTSYDGQYTSIKFQGFEVKIKGKVEEGKVIRKKQRTDIWRYDKPVKSELHSTMKPVALVTEAIVNSSKRGEIVMDLTVGSGTTLISAEKSARACYAMELDPRYIDVILDRWSQYAHQDPIRLGDNKKWSQIKNES